MEPISVRRLAPVAVIIALGVGIAFSVVRQENDQRVVVDGSGAEGAETQTPSTREQSPVSTATSVAPAAASPAVSTATKQQQEDALNYWTPERIASAVPAVPPAADSGLATDAAKPETKPDGPQVDRDPTFFDSAGNPVPAPASAPGPTSTSAPPPTPSSSRGG